MNSERTEVLFLGVYFFPTDVTRAQKEPWHTVGTR